KSLEKLTIDGCLPAPDRTSEFIRLVARIRAGDERALECLLKALSVVLHRMADEYIGNALRPYVDGEDLVQRVALTLWTGLRQGKFVAATAQQLTALGRTLLKREAARTAQRFKADMAVTVEGNLNATLADHRLMPPRGPAEEAEATDQIHQIMKRANEDD